MQNYMLVDTIFLIAWTPAPLPALFELENFALVPRRSVIGIIEIKRSSFTRVSARRLRVFSTGQTRLSQPQDMGVGDCNITGAQDF